MDQEGISALRLQNQHLTSSHLRSAEEVASRMGALQAQDYNMSKWALGIRMRDPSEKAIDEEIDAGRLIRTHLLRPTWHIVSAEDLHWILALSAPRIKAAMRFRDNQLELNGKIYRKSFKVIENALAGNRHKTREELISVLGNAKIRLDGNRASHILMRAELEGIICSGKQVSGRPTYAILDEWVTGRNKKKTKDEALKDLALRYFGSRGPATVEDFKWWSGLSLKESRLAVELNKSELNLVKQDDRTFWFADPFRDAGNTPDEILLLPAYDEYLISYRDRSASLSHIDDKKVVSNNGIFYPTILKNGQVTGIWRRNLKKDVLVMSFRLFDKINKNQDLKLKEAVKRYSVFTGREIIIE